MPFDICFRCHLRINTEGFCPTCGFDVVEYYYVRILSGTASYADSKRYLQRIERYKEERQSKGSSKKKQD